MTFGTGRAHEYQDSGQQSAWRDPYLKQDRQRVRDQVGHTDDPPLPLLRVRPHRLVHERRQGVAHKAAQLRGMRDRLNDEAHEQRRQRRPAPAHLRFQTPSPSGRAVLLFARAPCHHQMQSACRVASTLQRRQPTKLDKGGSQHCERRDLVAVSLPDDQLLHGGCKRL